MSMIWSTIALYFLSLTLSVLCAADVRIFGIQEGDDPFKLTILCPEGGNTCLFNLPGLRQQFRTIKVETTSSAESGLLSFVLEWDLDALEAYVNAVRQHGIFSQIREDGFSYVDFYLEEGTALVDLGLAEGEHTVVPQLDAQEAERLCQQLGCL